MDEANLTRKAFVEAMAEVVVGGLGEHEVEGGGGFGQETAAQFLTVGRHDGGSQECGRSIPRELS
jgi:hypothetical protein